MIGASELIETTLKLYRKHFGALLKNVIWIFALVSALQVGIGLLLDRVGIPPVSLLGTALLAPALFIVFLLIQLALMIMLIAASDRLIAGTPLKLSELIKAARSRFWSSLGVYFLIGAMIAAIGIPAYLTQKLPLMIVAGVIATAISLFFSFSPPEIILRGGTVKNALLTSLGLIRSRFWRIAWRLFAPTLFFGVAVSLMSTLIGYAAKGTTRDITDALLNALAAPLFIIPLILLYRDLRKV